MAAFWPAGPLNAAWQKNLLEAIEQVEHEDMGAGTHEKSLKTADELCRRYGVAVPGTAEPVLNCCHHHKGS